MDIDSILNETSEDIKKNWAKNEIDVQNRQLVVKHFGSIKKVHEMTPEQITSKFNNLIKKDVEYEDIEDMVNSLVGLKRLSTKQGDVIKKKSEDANGYNDPDEEKKLTDMLKTNKKNRTIGMKTSLALNKVKRAWKGKK